MNLALEHLLRTDATLDDYDGDCMGLSDEVSQALDQRGVAHHRLWLDRAGVDAKSGRPMEARVIPTRGNAWVRKHGWVYHVVVVVDGLVHDPWFGKRTPSLKTYLGLMFPKQEIATLCVDCGDGACELLAGVRLAA